MLIGVLALQGDFSKHLEAVRSLGIEAIEIRTADELNRCDGLIIPGGESTVIMQHIETLKLRDSLLSFALNKPVFGTCAGLILMSKEVEGSSLKPLGLLDISVRRNAFGRQVESFQTWTTLTLSSPHHEKRVEAFFIRAPRIKVCAPSVKVLGRYNDEPILVQSGHCLAATFHPELTRDPVVHRYFLEMVAEASLS